MKAKHFLLASALLLWTGVLEAQTYQVPVSEKNEKCRRESSNLLGNHCRTIKFLNGLEMQIWYLGTLGTAMCGRVRRLDGAFSLFGRFARV